MRIDELVDLTRALLREAGGEDISVLRSDKDDFLSGLTNDEFLLAVRFLAGEGPDLVGARGPRASNLVRDDDRAERLAALEEEDEVTPAGPLDLGEGITLP